MSTECIPVAGCVAIGRGSNSCRRLNSLNLFGNREYSKKEKFRFASFLTFIFAMNFLYICVLDDFQSRVYGGGGGGEQCMCLSKPVFCYNLATYFDDAILRPAFVCSKDTKAGLFASVG